MFLDKLRRHLYDNNGLRHTEREISQPDRHKDTQKDNHTKHTDTLTDKETEGEAHTHTQTPTHTRTLHQRYTYRYFRNITPD